MELLKDIEKVMIESAKKDKSIGIDYEGFKLINSDEDIKNNLDEIVAIGEIFVDETMLNDSVGDLPPKTHEEFYCYLNTKISVSKLYAILHEINQYSDDTGVEIPVSREGYDRRKDWYIEQLKKIDFQVLWYIFKLVNPLPLYQENCLKMKINKALEGTNNENV